MGAQSERRGGQFGNARGKPDRQVRNRRNREADPRYQAAMAEVRRNQELVDKLAIKDPIPGRPKLVFEKPSKEETQMTAAPVAQPSPPSAAPMRGRFVPCHCGHGGHPDGPCHECACARYRPSTAPDPEAQPSAPSYSLSIEELLAEADHSRITSTVKLATKIREMVNDLERRVHAEAEEIRLRAERERAAREQRERVDRLRAELAEAEAALKEAIGKKPKVARKAASKSAKSEGEYKCPTCEAEFGSPTAVGAHRSRKHGYRKGDDDK